MKNTILYIIISVISIALYTIYGATKSSNKLLAKYKQEEIYKVKQNLKNFVDVAYSTIDSNYKNSMDKHYLEKHYGHRLINIIDVAETILISKAEEVKNGQLSLAAAQAEAIKAIQKIRYDNGRGSIWINDTTLPYPKMIMHPTMPSLNGQIMDDPKYNCAMGQEQNLFVAFVEVTEKPEGGFVDYLRPQSRSDGLTTDVPKLSYVRRFPAWNWIMGTEFYVNDAILDGLEKSKEELRQMRYDNGIGFFWINNTDESSPQFYMYPIAASIENVVLTGGQLDKLGNVIKSFIKICKQKGSGYVNYSWDKPTLKKPIKDVPKLSYVKLYEPLGWIIGTGVYIDDVERAIAREKELLQEQVRRLIFNILKASIVFILFFTILHIIVDRYFTKAKPKPAPTVSECEDTPPTTKTKAQPEGTMSVNDSLKFAQEISKVILAEQTKLLAFAISLQSSQKDKEKSELANDVKELAEHVSRNRKATPKI
jgi:methyl-accepting chemotaxis protein